MQNNNSKLLRENLEHGDLARLVHNELHIDEYKSKMGDDADVCVVSFKVSGKEPSADLVSFIEKGYDWVLDADVSSGEKEGGDYLVFVEVPRDTNIPKNIYQLMLDILNLTEQEIEEWRVRYQDSLSDHDLSEESLAAIIPLTAEKYKAKYEKDDEDDDKQAEKEINQLKIASGLDVDTKAPKNDFTESLRIAAGIK